MQKTFYIKSQIKEIRSTTQQILSFVDTLDISENDRFSLEIVLNEAISNAVQYGSSQNKRKVEVNLEIQGRTFSIYIRDAGGKVFDPEYFENMALIKDWGKGGRGIFLISEFMDVVQYIIFPGKSTALFLSKLF